MFSAKSGDETRRTASKNKMNLFIFSPSSHQEIAWLIAMA
jgi:hypothetical protein